MIFEVGKCYKHTSGKMLSIVGTANTTMFGETLIAEQSETIEFMAVGNDEDAAANWSEIDRDEWLTNFSE